MSKENVKAYLKFIRETNRPLYLHEMYDVMDELKELESKLSIREISDIKFLSDLDICIKYNLEPKDINPKYIGYVIDEESKKGDMIKKVLSDKLKTDYETVRNNLVKQIMERASMLRKLDEERFLKMKL